MDRVYSLEQACGWFIDHASGSVCCIRSDGEELVCDCYPQAKRFYNLEVAGV